jgi:hypothetical protein
MHNHILLYKKIEFDLTNNDEDILNRLTRNSIWAGRYPVPTGPDASQELKKYSDGRIHLTAYFAPTDIDDINKLIKRVQTFVELNLKEEMHNQ